MGVYIARRLLWLPVLLFAASFMTFALVRLAPGDPVEAMMGNRYDPESPVAINLRESLGLNDRFMVQYGKYMWGTLHGDFGESLRYRGRSVGSLLGAKIWVSFQVNAAALIVIMGAGLPLGFWIAHRQGTWLDPTTVGTAVILESIPIMVTLPAILWLGCLKLHWIPCSGWGGFFDARIVVVAIAMGLFQIAGIVRLMRASTLDVMGQDFIRTARAKGLSEFAVDSRHVLKNSLIPVVTIMGFVLAGMMSTGFVAELILGIPGVGRFALQSVWDRDYPVLMAITLIGAGAFVVANLLADIAYTIIDPRIRYQ